VRSHLSARRGVGESPPKKSMPDGAWLAIVTN
jgi:hypothetical protein